MQGALNANANSLAMMILLALGTFVAGVQASVWRDLCGGGVLFLAVPGLGWLDQSPLLLMAATLVIIVLGGPAWWVNQKLPSSMNQVSTQQQTGDFGPVFGACELIKKKAAGAMDFPLLMIKAAELYASAPSLFYWLGGLFVSGVWGVWWFRGHLVKEQIATLERQLSLAKDQNDVVKREADNSKAEVARLNEKIAMSASLKELAISTATIDGTIDRLISANKKVSGTLTPTGLGYAAGLLDFVRKGNTS